MNDTSELRRRTVRWHLAFGWWGLLVFLGLGLVLETLLGWKSGLYLDAPNRWRRELWRLAHAHGTFLSLVQILFACTLDRFGVWTDRRLKLASFLLLDGLILLPLGFFLGGIGFTETDPGVGILLVPIGALALLAAVGLIACSVTGSGPAEIEAKSGDSSAPPPPSPTC
jgi:hypothetical protein